MPFFVNTYYVHLKDSNEYDIWTVVKIINIRANVGNFYEKEPPGV
jgi:hypothetical protein